MKTCWIYKTVALIATKKILWIICLHLSHATVPSSQFFQVMFEGSCYKQIPSGLGAWVTPNTGTLPGKPGQELKAVVGGSFPSCTVSRSGKYQNTKKTEGLKNTAIESSVCSILYHFSDLFWGVGPPHWKFCAVVGPAVQTDDSTDVLSSCFALDITYIPSPSKPFPKPGVCSHDSSCFVSPQHSTHWPALTAKIQKEVVMPHTQDSLWTTYIQVSMLDWNLVTLFHCYGLLYFNTHQKWSWKVKSQWSLPDYPSKERAKW